MSQKYKQIAAGWIKKTKNGEDYMAVAFSQDMKFEKGDWLNLWKNRRKFKAKHPDFVWVKKVDKEEADKDQGNYKTKKKKTNDSDMDDWEKLASDVEDSIR